MMGLFAIPPPVPVPKTVEDLKCPNCGAPLAFKQSKFGPFYGCSTWRSTGCKGSVRANADGSPVGLPVDEETKRARMDAHDVFDQLWKGGRMSRNQAYYWLARQMGLPHEKAHMGLFSKEECQRVVELVGEALTENEQLLMAERDLMGESFVALSDEERAIIAALPRDRDKLARKIRGGYIPAGRVCQLLRISLGADESITARNIVDVLREFDRRGVRGELKVTFK